MALPGGVVQVEVEGLGDVTSARAFLGEAPAELMGASSRTVTFWVPEGARDGVLIRSGTDEASAELKIGRVIASELHPVTNPVVDSFGNVYVTFSGTRGEKVPFSVFAIYGDESKQPFLTDITNPTAMAIGPDNCLYLTSRHTGAVYRSTFDKQVEKHIDGLGLATGLAFDSQGNMLVGDRSGTIYKVTPEKEISVLCGLEPSVSAYHLLMGPDDALYVTGPTLATQDSIYRILPDGTVSTFFKELGRPQGMAFDRDGNLVVAASYRGRKGIYTVRGGTPELTVSAPMLVGLAYSPNFSELYLVDSDKLYRIKLTG